MQRLKKSLLIGLSVFAGLLVLAAVLFYIRFNRATKAMTPSETVALNDTVYCIKDSYVNAYLFKGNRGYLLVDAGFREKRFNEELEKLAIDPDKIINVFLTHSDLDHIAALGLFKNASVYMRKDEEQMINGTTGKMKFLKTKWKYGPYKLLNDNDTLTIDGLKIKVLHTPGHTPGSCCFIVGNDYLLTGDNLILKNGNYEHFTEMFNMDTPLQNESIKKLPTPGTFKFILTGHSGIVKN